MPPILSLFYLGFHFYHLIGNSEPYLTEVNVCFSFSCLLSRSVMSDSFDPKNSSPSGFSVHGILQARILKWVACPPPWDLPDPGIKPTCLMSPALRSRFFANSATCEALVPLLVLGRYIYLWIRVSQVVLVIKNPPANEGDARDSASIPGLGRSPEVEILLLHIIPVFLPEKFHGQRRLPGYSPWDCKESHTTEWLNMHTQ